MYIYTYLYARTHVYIRHRASGTIVECPNALDVPLSPVGSVN